MPGPDEEGRPTYMATNFLTSQADHLPINRSISFIKINAEQEADEEEKNAESQNESH